MRVELINPFVASTQSVFQTMLGCTLTRGPLSLKGDHAPMYEVSGLIGLCGKCQGMVVVSLSRETALEVAATMLGDRPAELDADVLDAVGELTNMIAGAAKTQLEQYALSISLPTVICGKSQSIKFPSESPPMLIPFESSIGPICVQVGMVEVP
jgi:chemotaxis protein CheX